MRKGEVEKTLRPVSWNSQDARCLTPDQQAELDRRLDAYERDGNPGRPADEAIADIRKRL